MTKYNGYNGIELIIRKDPNFNDYTIKFYENGKFNYLKSRHSDTLDGAIQTMHKMAMEQIGHGFMVIEDPKYS